MRRASLITSLLCILLSTHVRADTYRVVTEEWAPYNYLENGQLTGLTTDVVRAIMAITGDDFTIQVLPSMRATYQLENNPKIIMYSLFRTADREPRYKWVGPIVEESIYPYQLANSTQQINSLEQLMSAPQITTRHAGLVPSTLRALGFNNLDTSASSSEQLYRMLLAGRTNIIIGDSPAGVTYYSSSLGIPPETLRQIPLELFRSSLYIAFSRDSDDAVVNRWSEALDLLRINGELTRIRRSYE